LNASESVIRFIASVFVALTCIGLPPPSPSAADELRFADVVKVSGSDLPTLIGRPVDTIGAIACKQDACHPVPIQIDERDSSGVWVLDSGPDPQSDAPARVLDDNDELLFMANDAGAGRARAEDLGDADAAVEITVYDPLLQSETRVFVFAGSSHQAPPPPYVSYDPTADRFTGARVRMGFGEAVPDFMALLDGDGANLLDRLKVRANASLFWGWLRFGRNEDDLSTERIGWRTGPIRIIRRQAQQVRLGWGIRSPTFNSYTYFYRDYAELPVGLRLRVPATYFFTDISITVVLDFRDLRGWRFHLAGAPVTFDIGHADTAAVSALNQRDDTSFALVGPQLSLVQIFGFSSSLETVRKRLVYREGAAPDPPESVAGANPSVGYNLERWDEVGAGEHGLTAFSYAVPPGVDVDAFLASRSVPLEARGRALPR
jgi:hypothetical protein